MLIKVPWPSVSVTFYYPRNRIIYLWSYRLAAGWKTIQILSSLLSLCEHVSRNVECEGCDERIVLFCFWTSLLRSSLIFISVPRGDSECQVLNSWHALAVWLCWQYRKWIELPDCSHQTKRTKTYFSAVIQEKGSETGQRCDVSQTVFTKPEGSQQKKNVKIFFEKMYH